ncbi:cytochrome P450 315a1, mitochondrial [Nilaparvata lugens]|uniref:cytochrome P450 315a1, mitochondrial n=1 Tax=Nilaparvata lugens TaxID=108931 RepID=UPI00193E7223|nr:cytochrome P450 315a1, mitochondrial [Nilaparvata lugens]
MAPLEKIFFVLQWILRMILTFLKSTLGKLIDIDRRTDEPPSPMGLPVVGTLFSLIAAGGGEYLHLYIDKRHTQLGKIFKEAIGPVDAVFVSDPKLIKTIYSLEGKHPKHFLPEPWVLYNEKYGSKRGLYFMDDEEWRLHRRILNESLLRSDPNAGLEDVHDHILSKFINDWQKHINNEFTVDEHCFYKLSISFFVASMMGSTYLDYEKLFQEDIEELASFIHLIFVESCNLQLLPAKLSAFLNLPAWRRFVDYVKSALDLGKVLTETMMEKCDENSFLAKLMNEDIPKDNVVRVVVDLILGGSDTTSNTIHWIAYELGRNVEVQNKLAENTNNASLVRGIVRETLRLYPAAIFIARSLSDDAIIGGYRVPAKTWLVMSSYTSGRNQEYFPNPDEFWPERWLKDETKPSGYTGVLDASASTPYGMGLRSCIGRRMSEALMTLFVKKIVTNFHLVSTCETDIILRLVPVPKTPVRLLLTERK